MSGIVFDDIDLDATQRQLFFELAEAHRTAPRGQRRFLLLRYFNSATPQLQQLGGQTWTELDDHDLDVLVDYGLLMQGFSNKGDPHFDVSPGGQRFYTWLREQAGAPVAQVEGAVRGFVDASWFRDRFPTAHEKWTEAVELLWSDRAERELSRIGHTCRESIQEFADDLVEHAGLRDQVTDDNAKDVARLRAVLDDQNVSGTRRAQLDALLVYWGTTSDLVQRQEHAAQKEGEPITWDDARRVVFHTLTVMYEVARTVES